MVWKNKLRLLILSLKLRWKGFVKYLVAGEKFQSRKEQPEIDFDK